MSSPDSNNRRNRTQQSIPLRDLNRPPDDDYSGYVQGGAEHRRTLSDRGRDLLRHSGSLATGSHWTPQYAPIAETSPSPTRFWSGQRIDTTPPVRRADAHDDNEDYSPVDVGAFQAAIGFTGLSFQGESSTPPVATPLSSERS